MSNANQYITLRSNGWYYYIRRVPVPLRGRIKQKGFDKLFYRVSLKTKDEREARRQASYAHEVYNIAVSLEERRLAIAGNQPQSAALLALEHELRKRGIHPSQAPTVNAPKEVQDKYLRDRDDFVWGNPRAEEGDMSLYEYQLEVGLNIVGFDDIGEPIYEHNERWDQVQQQLRSSSENEHYH